MIKQFFKPTSLEEALMLKEKYENTAAWFAGGTHINHAAFATNYEKVISLEGLGLHYINAKDKYISVGSAVTLQRLIDNGLIPESLRTVAANSAPRSIRNMATIGGDIAIKGRWTRLVPCLIALKAKVKTANEQIQSIEEYIEQNHNELILKITLPLLNACASVRQYKCQSSGPILVSAATSIMKNSDGKIENPIIAISSLEASPRRLTSIEQLLLQNPNPDRADLEAAISETVDPIVDHTGSIAFKKYIAGITISDCIFNCLNRG